MTDAQRVSTDILADRLAQLRALIPEATTSKVLMLPYKPYDGRSKMIYVAPPYNTGNDAVYPDKELD